MATIRQRGTKWQCIIKRTDYPPLAKSFDIKKDADKWGREQEQEIDSGRWVDRSEAQRATLSELLDRYTKEVSPSKRGRTQEFTKLTVINRHPITKYSVANITGKLVAEWRDTRLQRVQTS